ncbi:MAG: ABC transporter ATP-binding protein/permease [Lachnospiraceae bacterium]|nr:ABC transporter ATP-binding protein/permease [Lachnospiraceae bacterium]
MAEEPKKKRLPDQGQNLRILKRVLTYIKHYIPILILSVLLAALTVVLTLLIPIFTGHAVDELLGPGQVRMANILKICLRIGITMGITAIAQWIMSICNNYLTYHVVRDIREDAMKHLHNLPIAYLDAHPSGDVVSRIITDADTFADGLLMGFTQLFTGLMTVLGTLGFMLVTNVPITLVVVILTPLSILVARYIAVHTHEFFLKQSVERGEQTAFIEEMVGNQKLVRAFSMQDRARQDFDRINKRLQTASLKAIFYSSLVNPSTRFINALVYAGVGVFGAYYAIRGGITVGQLSCFLAYSSQYAKPFNEISGVLTELQNAFVCAGRIFDLIDTEPEPADAPDARVMLNARGKVDFNDVEFYYDPEKPLIRDLNLHVTPGQKIAIVGPTGCGKTTLINLLMRFYDVIGGSVCVEDSDIRNVTRGSLRSSYGMVLQETWLRKGTIRENIAFGRPDAPLEEIVEAAKNAHAHNFIMRLPKGYDTEIGEDGGSLSQGQKQLLCIARVMLCLPPMLILDEATSSIDVRTEVNIQKAFTHMMQGRTSFIVAHRLSTIREADVILVMKDGDIVEQGRHAELLERNGFYKELYNSQFVQLS